MSIERALRISTIQAANNVAEALRHFTSDIETAIEIARSRHSALDFESALWLVRECDIDLYTITIEWRDFYKVVILEALRRFGAPWLSAAVQGRDRLWTAMPRDQRQCLVDIGVFDSVPTEDVRHFWDEITSLARFRLDQIQLRNGSSAEMMAYDAERLALVAVGRDDLWPEMTAMDDSSEGYDIKSYAHDGDINERRYIEIKGFSGNRSVFFLSRGEWEAAQTYGSAYRLQVWSIDERRLVRSLTHFELSAHIPEDRGSGRWQKLMILIDGSIIEVSAYSS
jgi:hypothetical protein